MMLPFATLVPFVVQAIRGGQGCGSRSPDGHGALSVSKRVLRDLVVQGIHYPYFHLAGPFQHLDSFGTDRVSFSVLVNSSATGCVIHSTYIYIYIHIYIYT